MIKRFLRWFHCSMSGHPMSVEHLEVIDGKIWPIRETCSCGTHGRPEFPGSLFKAHHDAYDELPTEWPTLFGEPGPLPETYGEDLH